jgi:hypothetical protein
MLYTYTYVQKSRNPFFVSDKPVMEESKIVLLCKSVDKLENTILIYGVIFATNKIKTVVVIR